MDVQPQIKLQLLGVEFYEVSFIARQPFNPHFEGAPEIQVDMTPGVRYPDEDRSVFQIVLKIKLEAESHFTLQVSALGTFQLGDLPDEAERKQFVSANAPAIVFPYVRAFIATLTANLGKVTNGASHGPPQFLQGDIPEVFPDQTSQEITD